MLLNRVVGQMNLGIFIVFSAKLVRTRSQIALLIPVPFEHPIDTRNQYIMPNVKFTLVIKERSLYVLLKYKGSIRAIGVLLSSSQPKFYIIEAGANSDSSTPISELPRLSNPDVSDCSILLFLLLKLLISVQELLILRILDSL